MGKMERSETSAGQGRDQVAINIKMKSWDEMELWVEEERKDGERMLQSGSVEGQWEQQRDSQLRKGARRAWRGVA